MSHPDIRPARILQPVPDIDASADQARYAVNEALRLVAAGYQLTPVRITRDHEGKKGANFYGRRWRHEDAWTSDPDQIRAWSIDYPDASYALRTGRAAGVDVIDLDVKGDVDAVTWWAEQGHDLGSMIVETPSGGLHLYLPACGLPTSAGMYAPGVDTRGDGGLVFAPGAYIIGEHGNYRIQGDLVRATELRPLDPQLVQAIRDADHHNASQYRADGAIVLKDLDWAENACLTKLNELRELAPRTGGSHFRDIQMGAAMMLGRLVEAGAAPRDGVIEALEDATIKVWGSVNDADTKNILSGLADGPRKERWRWRPEPPNDASGEPPTDTGTDAERNDAPGSRNLPDAFWEARPALKHIANAAAARWGCADAVLAAMLARQASHMSPDDTVDIGLGPGPLNLFAILYGPSSAGKGIAAKIAKRTLPRPTHLEGCDYDHHPRWKERPLGSGEGLVESYFGIVEEPHPDDDTRSRKVKKQVRRSIMFTVDEGEAFTRKASRNGTTIAQVIRSAWSGETLGESNATSDRDRQLDEGDYAIGMTILFQPETIGPLFDPEQVGGGTPQRFLYASADNDLLPEQPPAELPRDPGPLRVARPVVPVPGHDGVIGEPKGTFRRPSALHFVLDDDTIREELILARWRGLRRDPALAELDGKRSEMRGRVAAVLAWWDEGRTRLNAEDWDLAGQVLDISDAVRAAAIGHGTQQRAKEAEAQDERYTRREVRAREAVAASEEQREQARLVKTAAQIARRVDKVWRESSTWSTGSEVRASAGDHKGQWRAAVDYAVSVEWLAVDDGENRGRKRGTTVWGPGPNVHDVPGIEL